MIEFNLKHPKVTLDMLGIIPSFLSEQDPRSAREQFNTSYRHGGGWIPFSGFKMLDNGNMKYPKGPEVRLIAEGTLHKSETIRIYEHAWVAIIQPNRSFEVCRMD